MDIFVTCQAAATKKCTEFCEELLEKEVQAKQSWCQVLEASLQDLARLAYQCQAAYHVGILLGSYASLDELYAAIETGTYEKETEKLFTEKTDAFRVRVKKHFVETQETSVDVAKDVGSRIHKQLGDQFHADMKTKQLSYVVIITETQVLFGLDCLDVDLTKRPYKAFTHPASVNGVMAFSAALLAGVQANSVVLDPFADAATIPIEIALYKNKKSPFIFDRQFSGLFLPQTKEYFEAVEKEIKESRLKETQEVYAFEPQVKLMLQAKKNTKLAGMHDQIVCSKVTTDWIDAKFEESTVDLVLTKPPQLSKRNKNTKQILKIYDELLYQVKFILKPKGTLALLLHNPEHILPILEKHQAKVSEQFELWSGEQKIQLLCVHFGGN